MTDTHPPLLSGSVTAAFVLSRGQTALHRPAPSGVRAGHGPPGHLPIGSGRLGVTVPVARLAQANPGPFPGHILARLTESGHSNTGRTHGSGRLRSQCPITARHMALTTATPPGPGYIPPARVHAPTGQAQSSRSPRRRTQQATEGDRCGYYDEAYVGARLKLYVQRTLELSYAGRDSHTMAPAVWHTDSAVLSEDLLGSNPIGIAPLGVHTLAAALTHQRTYSSHVRRRKLHDMYCPGA